MRPRIRYDIVAMFVITIDLSNVINNVAAAIFMAPVALSGMPGISGFPMLRVALASALPFLTPIGHQSSLVMEAGGYKFSDYVRLGLPLTAVCIAMVLLLVPVFWPF